MRNRIIIGFICGLTIGMTLITVGSVYFSNTNLIIPTGTATGFVRGGISFQDNINAVTLNSASKIQITDFDTNDQSCQITVDHVNDDLTIIHPGDYLALMFLSVMNNASQQHTLDISMWKNNGATELLNVHVDRDVSGGVPGDTGSISGGGLVTLEAGDTIEAWATTGDAGDRSVTFTAGTLTLIMVGR